MSDPIVDPSIWARSDKIQLWQTIGLWVTGLIGTLFVWRQNKILHRQNQIIENQRPLNDLLMQRERAAQAEEDIKRSLENIRIGALKGDGAIDEEVVRLLAKEGMSKPKLRVIMWGLHETTDTTRSGVKLLDASYERLRRTRAIASVNQKN